MWLDFAGWELFLIRFLFTVLVKAFVFWGCDCLEGLKISGADKFFIVRVVLGVEEGRNCFFFVWWLW